jgi:hypothetical protein
MTITVADLREILNDPDLPGDLPVRILTGYRISTWEWTLERARLTLAGDRTMVSPCLVLELRSAHLAEDGGGS